MSNPISPLQGEIPIPTDHPNDINEIAAALARAQSKYASVRKSGYNPHFGNNFATHGDILAAVQKPLNDEGIAIVEPTDITPSGDQIVCARLLHKSGQSIEARVKLIYDPNKMQSLGSAITYGRRYALAALTGVQGEEDDDGEEATKFHQPAKQIGSQAESVPLKRTVEASGMASEARFPQPQGKPITEKQVGLFRAKVKSGLSQLSINKMLMDFGVERAEQLTMNQFNSVLEEIEKRKAMEDIPF